MKHAAALIVLLSITAMAWIGGTNRVAAHDSLQSIGTPTPVVTKTPSKQPISKPPGSAPVFRSTIVITRSETGAPAFAVVSSDLPPTSSVTFTVGTLKWPGPPLSKEKTFAELKPTTPVTPGDFVDNWEILEQDDFEGAFPNTPACVVRDFSNDGFDRYWGLDSTRYYTSTGTHSIWPARGGANGLDPSINNYPPNLDTWLICGPYDFTNAKFLLSRNQHWLDIPDLDGEFQGNVISTGGTNFFGILWWGIQQFWVEDNLWWDLEGQPQVWVALMFHSDSDNATGKGAWIDDWKVWRYNKPAVTCGNLDPGNKGVNISAYDTVNNVIVPTIRAGDTQVVQGLMAAGAHWARLPILQNNAVFIDDQAYDRMVDTLCNAGISTMPLFDHESISRSVSDANNDATAASYRTDFANRANALAGHFKGRVKYWQVWNEPVDVVKLSDSHYAALLTQTANSIKTADPNAKVVAAGLDHAWNTQNNYFIQVYLRLDQQQNGARPFDVFAIHPYNDNQQYSMNPVGYMHQTQEISPTLGDRTIIDKFVRTMEANLDTGKKVWVSEVGWNSSLGAQNAPWSAVSETFQALYLQSGFDILFNEARSVGKIFWYKYMDENVGTNMPTFIRIQNGEEWLLRHPDLQVFAPSSPSVIVPGWWGLYRTTKLDAKPSRCAFSYYPQRCPDLPPPVFLPLILNGQ